MNEIILKGTLKNIQHSHNIGDVEYDKADLIVKRDDGKEDILSLKFKKFSNKYKDNDSVELVGNVRSYSQKINENKNKVDIHVFTYFDLPQDEQECVNKFEIDGHICKKDVLRKTPSGKEHCHFILANNIIQNGYKLNSYLPVVIWGKDAVRFSENQNVGDLVKITGQMHSREYTKNLENGEIEFRIAVELVALSYEVCENAA